MGDREWDSMLMLHLEEVTNINYIEKERDCKEPIILWIELHSHNNCL